jgi:hypothetical protein
MMKRIVFLLLFLLPIFFLFPHTGEFIFQPASEFSDMAVSHFPNGIYIQNAAREWGALPAWSSMILSGFPLVANPLSGLHYPPGWPAFGFELPLGFHLMIFLHLILGGIGAFTFLKLSGLSEAPALFGGLLFESFPKIFAHLGAGHITLVYAVCWLPWLLVAELKSMPNLFRWIAPGMVLGCIALADIRWAAYSGMLWLAYSFYQWIKTEGNGAHHRITGRATALWAASRATNGLAAFFLSAPLLLPLFEYLQLSTRSSLSSSDHLALSLPPAQFINLIIPNIGGNAEWILYPGAVLILLTIYAVCHQPLRRLTGFWLGVIAASLLIATGSYLPFLEYFYRLPVLNLLRVPSRVIFLVGFAFSVVSAYSLQDIIGTRTNPNRQKDWSTPVMFAITVFVILMAAGVWVFVNQVLVKVQFLWSGVVLLLGFILIQAFLKGKLSPGLFFVFLTSIALIDTVGVNSLSLVYRSRQAVLSQGVEVVDYLSTLNDQEPYRTYSPSYSIPQQTSSYHRVELADGVDPLQLVKYAAFMEGATGVPSQGYSVTLPPFVSGNPHTDNQAYSPDPQKLGILNVKYVIAEFPLDVEGLRLLNQVDQSRVYLNKYYRPRAWLQEGSLEPNQAFRPVTIVHNQPGMIKIEAIGPGVLVLSELDYPGWQVTIDHSLGQIITAGGLLRGVELEEGSHLVEFSYRPRLLLAGLFLSCTSIVIALIFTFSGRVVHYE